LSIQENEAKKYKWVEGTKPFEKIIEIREKLQNALGRKKA
jgi:hypothetical protein